MATAKRGNMFAAFADDDEEVVPQQKAAPQKKPAAQPKPQEVIPQTAKPQRAPRDDTGFDVVVGAETKPRGERGERVERGGRGGRGGEGARGGRGGRGGEGGRGGRGGRGERREDGDRPRFERGPREEGGRGGRGGRGRGRGDRPPRQTEEGEVVEGGDEGIADTERKERVDFEGKEQRFQGKPREQWHKYDRQSGTGRGRGLPKGGHGKGNWGDQNDEVKGQTEAPEESPKKPTEEGEVPAEEVKTAEEEEQKEEEAQEERYRDAPEEKEEEEEKGLTFQEYLAQKKKATFKKEARKPEELKKTGIEKVEAQRDKVESINSNLRNNELYNASTAKSENANLLGFQGGDDEFVFEERRRGGRGGRGGFRGGKGPQKAAPRRGGLQTLRVDENDFPSLS